MSTQHRPIVRWVHGALAACAVVALASDAHARTETLRWIHPAPSSVAGFRIHVGSSPGGYGSTIDARLPTPVDGVYSHSIVVADLATVYVAVSAYASNGTPSPYSNERTLLPPGGTPPPPPPPPPPPDPTEGTPLYLGDFEGFTAGSNPSGWYDTAAQNGLTRSESLFSVTRLGGSKGIAANNVLQTISTDANVHSHYVTAGSGDWSGYAYRGRMRIEHADGGVGVTSHSQYPNADAYYGIRRYKGDKDFHLLVHPGGSEISCASKTTRVVPEPKVWYEFHLVVFPADDRTIVRARVWSEVEPEPPNWQIDCEDTRPGRLVSGAFGVWSQGAGAKYWDDLEVVELGDSLVLEPPPKPILKLEP